MKHILIIFCLISLFTKSQTCTLVYDNMETYTWFGNWNTIINTGFYSDASVSTTLSGVLYGSGNGSSAIESANYILPNVSGLNTAYAHRLTFRLASYRFSNPTAATTGVDGPDYVDVRYSTNNGTTYTTEMRIAGNANAYWNYNALGIASKTASGIMTTYAPIAGGNRTATGDGYSVISLTIPAGATQLAFTFNARVNSAGEEWWIDNIELIQLGPCAALPIELISFEVVNNNGCNVLTWITATEINNKEFKLYRSTDGLHWSKINTTQGAGTINTPSMYSYKDYSFDKAINYYKLIQTNFDGSLKEFNTIYIDNSNSQISLPFKVINLLGQDVNADAPGLKIYYYTDGSSRLVMH